MRRMCSHPYRLVPFRCLLRLTDQKPTWMNLRYTSLVSIGTDSVSLASQTVPTVIQKETHVVNMKGPKTDGIEARERRVRNFLDLLLD